MKLYTILRVVPLMIVMGAIFYISHQPGHSLTLPGIRNIDKVAHMFVYGVLAGTIIFAFAPDYKQKMPGRVVLWSILLCLLYGISDEIHQSFVVMRYATVSDVIADTLGALMATGYWFRRVTIKV